MTLALAAVARDPRKIAGVAEALGYSRTALSLYLNGKYAGVEAIEHAIVNHFDTRDCPHTGEEIAAVVCRRRALAPQPFGGTARLAQWETCQTCPHKPIQPVLKDPDHD